jgi:hypothetical protein
MQQKQPSRVVTVWIRRGVIFAACLLLAAFLLPNHKLLEAVIIAGHSGARLFPSLLVLAVVVVCGIGLLKMSLEEMGVFRSQDHWQDWRETPLEISPEMQVGPTKRKPSKRLLQDAISWTHRGRVRARRGVPAKKHWGVNRS